MNSNNHKPFHFKQFSINHHNSTMKVGTDAILLGCWCDISNAEAILDIGTGSGIIALLIAARSSAKIDAVELDKPSAIEAGKNFNSSPTTKQLNIYNINFNDFVKQTELQYDVIISNPPFFSNDLLPRNPSRKAARHIDELSHNKLCEGVEKLLTNDGKFNVVLPIHISTNFIKTAQSYGLHLHRKLLISAKPGKNPNRVNLEFRFENRSKVIVEKITIRDENGLHSEQYKFFVGNFLMKFK